MLNIVSLLSLARQNILIYINILYIFFLSSVFRTGVARRLRNGEWNSLHPLIVIRSNWLVN